MLIKYNKSIGNYLALALYRFRGCGIGANIHNLDELIYDFLKIIVINDDYNLQELDDVEWIYFYHYIKIKTVSFFFHSYQHI